MMRSKNQTKIEELNALIDEVENLQSNYNNLVEPIVQTKMDLQRHKLFFNNCKTTAEEDKETAILKKLEKRLKELNAPDKIQTCEKLNAQIDEKKKRLELLWIEIKGKCDRSSPSFLEKIQSNQ